MIRSIRMQCIKMTKALILAMKYGHTEVVDALLNHFELISKYYKDNTSDSQSD